MWEIEIGTLCTSASNIKRYTCFVGPGILFSDNVLCGLRDVQASICGDLTQCVRKDVDCTFQEVMSHVGLTPGESFCMEQVHF